MNWILTYHLKYTHFWGPSNKKGWIAPLYRRFWNTSIQNFLVKKGIHQPTTIQRLTRESIVNGKNALILAETGSGKTYSYLLPLMERFLKEGPRKILILVPTFELKNQIQSITRELDSIGPISEHVQVSTPGKLANRDYRLDLIKSTDTIVMDEADSLVGGGTHSLLSYFINDAIGISRARDSSLQWLFVAATWPHHVAQLIHRRWKSIEILKSDRLHRPVNSLVEHYEDATNQEDRKQKLIEILSHLNGQPTLIFVNTRESAETLYCELKNIFPVARIHNGLKSRDEREQAMDQFKKKLVPFLICTDNLSRGMDLNISNVIQYEFASSAINYLHRIGRTARLDTPGTVYHLVMPNDKNLVNNMQPIEQNSLESVFSRKRSFRKRSKRASILV